MFYVLKADPNEDRCISEKTFPYQVLVQHVSIVGGAVGFTKVEDPFFVLSNIL